MSTQVTSLIEWAAVAATLAAQYPYIFPYEIAATHETVERFVRLHLVTSDEGVEWDNRR